MHRAIPVGNKYLDEKWNRLQHQKMRDRVKEQRPTVGSAIPMSRTTGAGSPTVVSPIKVIINRAKRDQIQEG